MNVFQSSVDTTSERFITSCESMRTQVEKLARVLALVQTGGHEQAREKHVAKGKMLVRDRVASLLDPGEALFEIAPLAAYEVYTDSVPSAGLVTGVGKIAGVDCMVIANDATVKGGTYYPLTVKKHLRAQQIAMDNHLPCIYLVDSGGANLAHQSELFADKEHFGRIFFNQARMSAKAIPQIAVVMGQCTAGGAYVPAMADETIMVRDQATIYLAGPQLVQAATGERVEAQALGGADLHCRRSGVADYLAKDDQEALNMARHVVANLNAPLLPTAASYDEPRYNVEEIYGIVPKDMRRSFDMREVMARVVDNSAWDEFKALYGQTVICVFGSIYGQKVGIIANQGVLLCDSALKATHFIELCCSRQIPLVFLQNITGFMVGQQVESEGIVKHGAKLVNAVACARVPKLTVICGGSFGAGNYGMCGRAYDPRFLWMWPSARISVMGGPQAAFVMNELNQHDDPNERDIFKRDIELQYEQQGSPYFSSARLWDDGVIDPAKTRDILGKALLICRNAPKQETRFGTFRM